MKTSVQWWNETKASSELTKEWLKNQYHGEVTAAARISEFASMVNDVKLKKTLEIIAKQEEAHAAWVRELLIARGIEADILDKESRYWSKTLPDDYKSLSTERLAAIGAHAEGMRLERIKVIANDTAAPEDIRNVFTKILPDEEFHERAFSAIAGDVEMAATIDAHREGLKALGLTI